MVTERICTLLHLRKCAEVISDFSPNFSKLLQDIGEVLEKFWRNLEKLDSIIIIIIVIGVTWKGPIRFIFKSSLSVPTQWNSLLS